MINALHCYCTQWCLNINLSKSKIIVFRKSPRIPSTLQWYYGDENIEIVNNYKYLGVILTYNLSFVKHLQTKLEAAKAAINANWLSYIYNSKITFSNKMKIFDTAAKSIMFYGAQVWGFEEFESVEKLFRFFVKKILFLPSNTPNYMLHLETGFASQFSETLKLHCGYIAKVLSMSDDRLPHILAKETIFKNIFWVRKWFDNCGDLGVQFDFSVNIPELVNQQNNVLKALVFNEHNKMLQEQKIHKIMMHIQCYRMM